jgi:hypothetical protein
VVFQGGGSTSGTPLQTLVTKGQAAATLDLIERAAGVGAFFQIVLVTEDSELMVAAMDEAERREGTPVAALRGSWPPNEPFHFGQALSHVCKDLNIERLVYIGGGAMPLGSESDLRDLALAVSGTGECVVANNLYSADMVAFYPASALDRIALPTTDNDLAWLLHFKAGLPFSPIPRTLPTQLDLDTPTDLATLWWAAGVPPLKTALGPHLTAELERVPTEMPHLAANVERAYKVMATRRAEVMVAGRVSSWVWRRLETNLPCQTRIVSEERGMRASGREERGEVRSLLGLYADIAGIPGLIKAIEQTSNAAFLDTRVLFAHRNLHPSTQDRFASDALLPGQIEDPWIRELTEAVLASSVPIVVGGHSLVSGGVWALSERVRAGGSAAG